MPHSQFCRPRGWLAVPLLAALLLLTGCREPQPTRGGGSAGRAAAVPAADYSDGGPRLVRDDAGRVTALPAPATRVVSLVPSQTEIIRLLAGPGVLVARTVWDTHPALAHLPHTENALSPSVEWLAALRPDLVIAWPDRDARTLIARLTALGIPVYAAGVETLADIDSTIARFGVLLGREAGADSLRRALAAQLEAVRSSVAGRPRPRVLYALSIEPPMVASNSTYLGELVELAGGANIFGELTTLWPQVSLEEIVRRQPEVIIRPVENPAEGDALLATLRRRAGWRDLPAVRSGRVHAVDVNLLNRPGASVGRAAELLAGLVHPASAEVRQ